MTPAETLAVIDAAAWRADLEFKRDIRLAWHVAAFTRAKRLPPLRRLLKPGRTRKLTGEDLAKRRAEHAELMQRAKYGKRS